MYRVKDIDIKDCEYILDNLRKEDVEEVSTTLGKDWKNLTIKALQSGLPFNLVKTQKDDRPVLMYGAWPIYKENQSIAVVWLLSTPEIKEHQIKFLREIKNDLKIYDDKYGILYNMIYSKNRLAKRWLKKSGFRFPKDEKKKIPLDLLFSKMNTPENFEVFYREREIVGLEI